MGVEEASAVPEDGVECPGERKTAHWEVHDEPIGGTLDGDGFVGEIECEKVDEVDEEDDLRNKEVLAHEKVAPEEAEDVVDGEVWPDNGQNVGLVTCGHV